MKVSVNEQRLWTLACGICTLVSVLFFFPATKGFYLEFGRHMLYFGLFVGLTSYVFIWKNAIKIKMMPVYLLASMKTVIFFAVFMLSVKIYVVSQGAAP
jgi:hypothetical protein